MLSVVFCSGPGGQWTVQSSSCGLLGKARRVLAAREIFRGALVRDLVCWLLCCVFLLFYIMCIFGLVGFVFNKALSVVSCNHVSQGVESLNPRPTPSC